MTAHNIINNLLPLAQKAVLQAYAPYSKFKVGASIRSNNNNYYAGANIENASYSLTLCAEATAIAHMIQAGDREILDIFVLSSAPQPCPPCGACRQIILEFSTPETMIHIGNMQGDYKSFTMQQLLPESFSVKQLIENVGNLQNG